LGLKNSIHKITGKLSFGAKRCCTKDKFDKITSNVYFGATKCCRKGIDT
jgi:hypothetical protein